MRKSKLILLQKKMAPASDWNVERKSESATSVLTENLREVSYGTGKN